jgi:nucleoid-associated protein YgaU
VLGWGSGYLGGRSANDVPPSNPARIVQMNEAAAAPSAIEEPKTPPMTRPMEAVEQQPTPAASPAAHDEVAAPAPALPPSEHPSIAHVVRDAAPAPAEQPGVREIVVPRGTSLSALTHQYYGGGSPRIMQRIRDLNPNITDVDEIFAGDRLKLPAIEELDRAHE